MPIRFLSNGVVETDSITEAIAWERRTTPTRKHKTQRQPFVAYEGTPWERFCRDLSLPDRVAMRKVLALIKGRGDGIFRSEIAKALNLDNVHVVAGVFAGIARKAIKHGLNPADVIERSGQVYLPGPTLRNHDPPVP